MRLTDMLSSALLATTLTFAAVLTAQAAPPPSGADIAALRDFTLSGDFLDKWKAVQMDAVKDPCNLGVMSILSQDENDSRSFDQLVASYDARPGVHAMLSRHGLTAHDYLAGALTLVSAGIQDIAQQHPEMVSKGYIKNESGFTVSDANMAFYRQHKTDIRQLMQKLGKLSLQANGGKLPDCAG